MRNSPSGSIGSLARDSYKRNAASSATPASSGTITAGLDQPEARLLDQREHRTAEAERAQHRARDSRRAGRRARARRARGITARISHTQAITSGMLITKIQRHDAIASSSPPASGPSTPAIAPHAVHAADRAPRSDAGNVFTITASELGTSSAPATPCSARAATSTPIDGADRAQQRGDAEARHADREHLPLAEQVAERPADQDQRAERQQIAVDDPLLRGQPTAERPLDRRQRDVDDRAVEQRDARAEDARHQCDPLDRRLTADSHHAHRTRSPRR